MLTFNCSRCIQSPCKGVVCLWTYNSCCTRSFPLLGVFKIVLWLLSRPRGWQAEPQLTHFGQVEKAGHLGCGSSDVY